LGLSFGNIGANPKSFFNLAHRKQKPQIWQVKT
jgi:hypothetical protein